MSTTTFVYTMRPGKPGAWSRYVFPFDIEGFAQLGDALYIRAGDAIYRVDEAALDDDGVDFSGVVQWPWLDFGQPGVTKSLEAFDYVGTGQAPSVAIGYDQRDTAAFTTAYQLSGDTLPGTPVPLPISAPTLSLKLTFAGGAAWEVQEVNLYLDDAKGQP